MKRLTLSSIILFLPIFVHGAENKFERTFTVAPDGLLKVASDFGDMTIESGSSDEVRILVTMNGSLDDLGDYEVTANQSGGTIDVRGKAKAADWRPSDDVDIIYTLVVPDEFNLDVRTAGGEVIIRDTNGKIQAKTSGGNIDLQELSGEIHVETSGGNISATDTHGNLTGSTSGGDIAVTNVKGNLKVESSGGNILIKAAEGSVSARTSAGNIAIALSGDNMGIIAETSSGDIDVLANTTIQANLDASAIGGSVMCSLPITLAGESDQSRLQGTLNGGGEPIRIQATGGNVRIKPVE